MEILESIAWITLGFVPIFGSMELAWRLRKKLVISKFKAEGETSHIEVSLPAVCKSVYISSDVKYELRPTSSSNHIGTLL